MVPSLHWLLLLWGLQGLWAEKIEEKYEGGMRTEKKKRQLPSNYIAQNGKCKLNKCLFLVVWYGICECAIPFHNQEEKVNT